MAYQALYRKYRPQTFDQVLGQESINRILKNQIKYNRVGHAYMLSGIRGTGKTSLAKIFARAINCQDPQDSNPCNQCETCLKITSSGIMDIVEIDGASNRGVDEMREIREKVKYPPVIGKYKVYIIDEVHMLTKEAFNALLKTLEEPPPHVVFILATTEPQKCPATILSRCQRFEVKPITRKVIVSQLRTISSDLNLKISDESLEFIASKGENSMRDALSLMDQMIDLKDENGRIDYHDILSFLGMASQTTIRLIIEGMLKKKPSEVILQLRDLQNTGKESQHILDQMIDYLRNILIIKSLKGPDQGILNLSLEDLESYQDLAKMGSLAEFYGMIDHFIEAKNKLKYSNLQNLILEMACLKLAYQAEGQVLVNEPQKESKRQVQTKSPVVAQAVIAPTAMAAEQETIDPLIAPKKEMAAEDLLNQAKDSGHGQALFQTLCNSIGSAQCIFLKKGVPSLTEEALFIDFEEKDQDVYDFINRPGHIENFEKILEDQGKKVKVAVRLQKEDFDELDLLEKTKRIINDDKITIVKDQ